MSQTKADPVLCICFKCKAKYDSNDASDIAGDGYCPPCFEFKTRVAKEIDAKMAGRLANSKRLHIPRLDELPTVEVRGMKFIPAKYFGL